MTSPTPLSLSWSGLTDKGRFRANNEDAFLALNFDASEVRFLGKTGAASLATADFVFAVSDGMGGAKSGEFASRIATERITRLLPRSFKQSAAGLDAGAGDILGELFTSIHADLLRLGRCYEECRGMGATLTLCWFSPGVMHFGHVGDSRLYYLPMGDEPHQLTHDDSYVGELRRKGRINEREARQHPKKNALTQALGAGLASIEPHVGTVRYEPGDRFLICSDGVMDGYWDHAVADLMRDGASASQIVHGAIAEGSRDNVTALVIDVLAEP
ncbi:MAG: Protein phosphatase [Verrucomicrobiaceae bacterium]|nr:Protein phosphatase [Verrucomicrobiaceae bacterium]